MTRYPHGTIAWTELWAGDVAAQRAFYASLLGWRFDDRGLARAPSDRPAAAVRAHDLRGWIPVIAVDAVDAGPQPGALEDPLGGHALVWDGSDLDGAHALNEVGGLAWNEVWTPDPAATIAFYRGRLGWNLKQQPGYGGHPYTMFAGRDRPSWTHAGIRSLERGPARWMSYFEVASCERTVEAARGLGAEITMPATHVAGVGWLATAIDREGSWFGLMQSG